MRKIVKAGLLLVGAGALLCVAVFAAGGFQFERVASGQSYEQRTYSTDLADVQKLSLDLQNKEVEIVPTDGDTIRLEYQQNRDLGLAFEKKDGVFTVKSMGKQRWQDQVFSGIFSGIVDLMHSRVTIRLPKQFTGALSIVNDNAAVRIAGGFQLGDLDIRAKNGGVRLEELACQSLRADTDNGSLKLLAVQATAGELSSDNGSVQLTGSTFEHKLTVETDNGGIRFQELSCPNLTLSAGNGSVKGSILGREEDYQIATDVENGSANLAPQLDSARAKQLLIRADNGSVRVTFTQP